MFLAFISILNSDWSFLTQLPLNKMRAERHDNGCGISFTQKPSHLTAASHTQFLSIRASQALLFPSENAYIETCDALHTHPMVPLLSACSRSSVCRIFCGGVKAPLKWDKTELQNWRNVPNCIFPLPLRYPAYIPPFSQTKLLQRSSLRTRRISSAT